VELFVDAIVAAHPTPFLLIVALSDGTFGVTDQPKRVAMVWPLGSQTHNRYVSYKQALAAYNKLIAAPPSAKQSSIILT